MKLTIEHETRLAFPKPVREHQCELRLAPREDETHRRLAFAIEIAPEARLASHLDCFGNLVHRFTLLAPHDFLVARMSAEVETTLDNPFAYVPVAPAAERAWVAERLRDEPALHDFLLHRSPAVPELDGALGDVALPAWDGGRTVLENMQSAMGWAHESFAFATTTEVHGALIEFAEHRRGVCQDFAHLLVALARNWGFPARYVMGYVDPGAVGDETPDSEAAHAWAEVLIPGAGWRGFDAMAGLVATDRYVPVAVGRDSRDAAPVRGTFKGDEGNTSPQVAVRVLRAAEEQAAQ
jgi:transglutaminase-like putative cysteine protease